MRWEWYKVLEDSETFGEDSTADLGRTSP
jgi:hypothetical protein